MLDLAEELHEWLAEGREFAVATVVSVGGSAPRGPGAALAVDREGTVIGSVSGGCVEGAVYALCQEALAEGGTVVQRFGYSDEDAFAVGLTCGGVLDIMVTPVGADAPARDALRTALTAAASGTPAALARVVRGRPNSSARSCTWTPRGRTGADWVATRTSTARRRTRPGPCWTRAAPARSRSPRTAVTARAGSPCWSSRACRRPG